MIQKWNVTIPELTGNEPRGVYLYLPVDYDSSPERHYPVLYMFDGHNVFFDSDATYGKSWGLGEYLDAFRCLSLWRRWSATTTRTTGGCRSTPPIPSTSPISAM